MIPCIKKSCLQHKHLKTSSLTHQELSFFLFFCKYFIDDDPDLCNITAQQILGYFFHNLFKPVRWWRIIGIRRVVPIC